MNTHGNLWTIAIYRESKQKSAFAKPLFGYENLHKQNGKR